MKTFYAICLTILLVIIAIFVGGNLYLLHLSDTSARQYRVEAERAAAEIAEKGSADMKKYPSIVQIVVGDETSDKHFFLGEDYDYIIKYVGDKYYRIDYINISNRIITQITIAINILLALMTVIILTLLLIVGIGILAPFNRLKNLPLELSKGNLTVPIKENKNRFFGNFTWGMNLLREKLEREKMSELSLQKEKKTLILSISHDIKTPLSAIKLYSKALSKNLYENREKQMQIAENINEKADEIGAFVTQIIESSNDDFLDLTVENDEFYLAELMQKITAYYDDKLGFLKIDFRIDDYNNCLLKGDFDRAIEVVQNVIENAVKYGDGHFIGISFSDEEDCRLLTVTNSGCTLSKNEMPHIFDSFWRGSNVSSNNGSGLGLYICRQLMNKMDGGIYADGGEEMKVTIIFRKA